MSATSHNKKRKSADANGVSTTVKKAKVVKSADRPAPTRSALKKSQPEQGFDIAGDTETTKRLPEQNSTVEETGVITQTSGKRSKNKAQKDEPSPIDSEDGGEPGVALTEDQTASLLAGFSSSEDEGSDEENEPGLSLDTIPTPSAIQKKVQNAIGASDLDKTPGVIYVGRIPHGFYEPQMRAYFSQFGDVLRLRLARSRKTGKSQHSAFIEFASMAVAEIAAKTMDKYLMFGHILQVRTVPAEFVKEGMFKGVSGNGNGRRAKKVMPRNKIERGLLRRGMDREGWGKRVEREEERRKEKAAKLKELGYSFDMPEVKSVDEVPPKAEEGITIENGTRSEKPAEVEAIEEVEVVQVPTVDAAASSTAAKKRASADGIKKIKKAKRVKTSA